MFNAQKHKTGHQNSLRKIFKDSVHQCDPGMNFADIYKSFPFLPNLFGDFHIGFEVERLTRNEKL